MISLIVYNFSSFLEEKSERCIISYSSVDVFNKNILPY